MKRLRTASVLAMVFVLAMSTFVYAAPPDPGTGNTDVVVMNVTTDTSAPAASVVAEYVGQSGNVEATKSPAGGVASLGAFEFRAADSGLGDGFNGSLIVSSDRDVAAVAFTGYTGGSATDDNKTGSAYSGFSEGSTTINIPSLFQRPNAQFSRITVQNMGTGVANVSLNYYSRDGTAFAGNPITDAIPEGAQRTYDLSQINPPPGGKVPDFPDNLADGWVGSLQVTSDKNIGAVISTIWEFFASAYESAASGSTALICPWASRRFIAGEWAQSIGVIVQNLSNSATANVTVNWLNRDGSQAHSFTTTIPALSAKGFNTRVNADTPDPQALYTALGDDWNGSVTISSDQPTAAVVDMNWRAQGQQAANTYRCESSTEGSGATSIFFPAAYRIVTGGTWQRYSSIIVQNVANTAANVTVRWYNRAGTLLHTFTDVIPGQSSHGFNTRFVADFPPGGNIDQFRTDLGDNFEGQVYVTSDQPLMGLGTTTYIGDVDTYNAYY
jgi:hypothetical protein